MRQSHKFSLALAAVIFSTTGGIASANTLNALDNPRVNCVHFKQSEELCQKAGKDLSKFLISAVLAVRNNDLSLIFSGAEKTIFPLPDGTVAHGIGEAFQYLGPYYGSTAFQFSDLIFTENTEFVPLDKDTVVVTGRIEVNLVDYDQNGITRNVPQMDTFIYRRSNHTSAEWVVLMEHGAYITPLSAPFQPGAPAYFGWQ